MLTLRKAGLIALLALAGCAQIEVRDADAAPGGTVTTEDHNKNLWLGWIPQVAPTNRPGIEHWTRIRVIAPEGATVCRSGNRIAESGPEFEGKPDAERVVMLTALEGARSAYIRCKTPGGIVGRTVKASVYTWMPPTMADGRTLPDGRKLNFTMKPRDTRVLPPLVHVDPRDPGAEARWKAIGAELCPVISDRAFGFVCKPGMLEKFKAEDLASP